MEITSATTSTATATPTGQSPTASAISADFETFLKMLTTQMQNQDPLDPMKSEDFAVQLATFSGVEQQVQTNTLLESLSTQMSLMGMSQLAGWVGMEAHAPVAGYFDGSPIDITPKPGQAADRMVLVVTNESGVEIERTTLPASDHPIAWSGELGASTAPHGSYRFTLESYSNGVVISTDQVEVYSKIVEARSENGQTILITEGGSEIPATEISGLREPVGSV